MPKNLFQTGQSGNLSGRPLQSHSARALRLSIQEKLPELIEILYQKALTGDVPAIKILMDKGLANLKPTADAVIFDIASSDSLADIGQSVIDMTSRGDITPDAANGVMAVLATQTKIIESTELLHRIEKLEQSG
jgi:hypothetical protein